MGGLEIPRAEFGDEPIICAGKYEYEDTYAHRLKGDHMYGANFLPLICFAISLLHTRFSSY